jgi:hypothetical protein
MPYIDTLPKKSEIFDYWKARLHKHGILIDWGEPDCWACGFHYGSKYDIRTSDAGMEKIFRCWDKVPLQRCHIIPKSLGGTDGVANLFLMCRECHDAAPNTPFQDIFLEWAKNQSHLLREDEKIKSAMRSFGLDATTDLAKIEGIIHTEQFKSWLGDKVGLHRPQSKYAPTSSRLTPSTIVGLAVRYMRVIHEMQP